MKIFLSALEQQATAYAKKGKPVVDLLLEQGIKMKYNLIAIEKFGFWSDIKVMFMTVFAVLGKEYKGEEASEN